MPSIRVQPYTDGEHGCILIDEKPAVVLTREQLLQLASKIYQVVNELDMDAAEWFYAVPGPLSLMTDRHLMRKSNLDARGRAACGMLPTIFTGESWNIIPLTAKPLDVCKTCLSIYTKVQQEKKEVAPLKKGR